MKKKNDELTYRLNKLLITGIFGIIFSLYLIVDNLIKGIKTGELVSAILLFAFSIFFLIGRNIIKNRQIKK